MSSPDPVSPVPPPKKRNQLLIGCLVILALLVLGAGAVLLLGIYAAKKEYDEYAPRAQQALEEARKAAASVQSAAAGAQVYAQGVEAQARLAMATRTIATVQDMNVVPCPPDPARASVPVDAEWFRALASGVPREAVGTPWFRHRVFETLAAAGTARGGSDEALALAVAAADRDLSDAGTVAVIHATKLQPPSVSADGKAAPGHFKGFVQLVKYPAGDSICLVPFSADGPTQEVFQRAFWAAEEAALGK